MKIKQPLIVWLIWLGGYISYAAVVAWGGWGLFVVFGTAIVAGWLGENIAKMAIQHRFHGMWGRNA